MRLAAINSENSRLYCCNKDRISVFVVNNGNQNPFAYFPIHLRSRAKMSRDFHQNVGNIGVVLLPAGDVAGEGGVAI